MFITAYTDASFHKQGGWAVWLRSERGRVIRQGVCPAQVRDSFAAELWAIKQALEFAVAEWPDSDVVLVNTDSLAAVDALENDGAWSQREEVAQIQEAIWSFVFRKYLTLRFKHVKAHTGQSDVRSYINRAVDQKAKAARKVEESKVDFIYGFGTVKVPFDLEGK